MRLLKKLLLIFVFLQVLIFSFLASLFLRKSKLISVEELNVRNVSKVNEQYGIKESKRVLFMFSNE